jgi:hypothetical protein
MSLVCEAILEQFVYDKFHKLQVVDRNSHCE